ncbi:MAG: tetratricopeptide repeat protein [Acidobacteriaceae bacterium]|nr:tetratricopeptide repeat protein [Acidobacteriaceae bacterium]
MRVLLLTGIMLFASIAAVAQHNTTARQQHNAGAMDPFDSLQKDVNRMSANCQGFQGCMESGVAASKPTVSIQELRHQPSKQAAKEYQKGRNAFRKGDYERALDHLQNAIQRDPDFADGHNDLGVVLGRIGNRSEAVQEFQKALVLVPDHKTAALNLCLSLYILGRYQDVVPLAYKVLNTQPTLLYVRYVLGMSLAAQGGRMEEAIDNLNQAAGAFPDARLMASKLLILTGHRDEAALELQKYLRSVPLTDPARSEAQAQLTQLQQ